MLLINRLKKTELFSNTETKIVDFILRDPKRILSMTIHELAEATFSSASTITRLCRKVETEGFSDFKLQLARELTISNVSDERIEDDRPFEADQSSREIVHRIMNLNLQAMNDTYNNIDLEQLERIAKRIYEVDNRYIYGKGQSLISAQDFHYKLLTIGINCDLESQIGFQSMKAASQPKNSLAIIVSYYGRGIESLALRKIFLELGIPYILFTGPEDNPLCDGAWEVVHVPPQETLIHKMAAFSSRTAIQLVLDFVYALIFSFDYEKNKYGPSIRTAFYDLKQEK